MSSEPKHTASKERNRAMRPIYINYYLLESEVSITLRCQLSFTQQHESRTVQKAPLQSK